MDTKDLDQWQLRRTGGPATCPLVLDVFALKEGTLTFGRNHKNDYFLDSRRLKNFISRTHAEITGYFGDNGLEFKIREKGLNGTFINDIRIQGSYILQEGDKVTFGHTNGYKIQPGEYSSQQNSEFEFVFEHVSPTSTLCNQHKLPSIQDYNDRSECVQQSCDGKAKNTTADCFQTLPTAGLTPEKTFDKNIPQFEFEKNNCILNNQNESKNCSKDGLNNSVIDKTLVTEVCLDSSSDSEKQDPDEQTFQNDETQVRCLSISSTTCDTVDGFSLDKDTDTIGDKLQDNEPLVPSKPDINQNLSDEKFSLQTLPCNETNNVTDILEKRGSFDSVSEHLLKPEENSNMATLQDIQNIDHVTNRPGTKYCELKHTQNTLNIEKDTSQSSIKKDQSKEIKSIANNKRKKAQPKTRPKKRRYNRSDLDTDELEDGVEWYEYETCASSNCTRPTSKRVAWVQCDDCDEWYHTVCADCNYEMVKDSKMQFHCGC